MPGQGKSLDGLHPTVMRPRVEAVLADPEARAMGVTVVSAFRSKARQAALFAAAVVRYGSVVEARKWVAPPGKSNHGPKVEGYGTAVDFGITGVKAVKGKWPVALRFRFDAVAKRHGLYSPMEWENWHFEPIPNWTSPTHPTEDEPVTDADAKKICDLLMTDEYLGQVKHQIVNTKGRLAEAVRGVRSLLKAKP